MSNQTFPKSSPPPLCFSSAQVSLNSRALFNTRADAEPWCMLSQVCTAWTKVVLHSNGPLDSSLMLREEKEQDIKGRTASWALGSIAPGIPEASLPSLRIAVSSHYTPEEHPAFRPPSATSGTAAADTSAFFHWSDLQSVSIIWGHLLSAERSLHGAHGKDAPRSSEHKENKKGLRAPSDGNVIFQAFYRHHNCPRVCLYMHTQTHTTTHMHTTNSMLWLKGKSMASHH